MHDWLAHRARSTPGAEALVAADSGTTWTYGELDEATDEVARHLAGAGVQPGDHVVTYFEPRPEYVTLVHAVARLGARLVPISHRLTAPELAPRLNRADATIAVVGSETEQRAVEATAEEGTPAKANVTARAETTVGDTDGERTDETADGERRDAAGGGTGGDAERPAGTGHRPETAGNEKTDVTADEGTDAPSVPIASLDEPVWERVQQLQATETAEFEPADWSPVDPLVSLFTSGSTGTPKLVTLTVGNVFASAVALAFRLGVDPDDRTLATLPFHHTGGLMPLYRATLAGTTIVLRQEFEAGAAADDVRRHEITKVSLVPTMLKQMLDARGTLADSLRVVLLGGAPASESLIERCRDYSVPVYPTYGMTEASSAITVATPSEAFDRPGTVGRPLLGTEVAVRDESREELAPGAVGEIVVSGPSITPGYYDDETANETAFGEHGLQTGDVGYLEDGQLFVLNRKDDRIVTGGENVDPGEVVGALRDHPHVADAAVVGVPDDEWGERVAALVVRSDESLGEEDLLAFCRGRLAGFKLPRTIRFTEELPRTDSGTVERPAVRQQLLSASTVIEDADDAERTAAPDEFGDQAGESAASDGSRGRRPKPTDGSEPTDDSEPTGGSESTDDSEPTGGSESTDDSEPTGGSESTDDSEPTGGSESTDDSEPTGGSESTDGARRARPDSGQSGGSVESGGGDAFESAGSDGVRPTDGDTNEESATRETTYDRVVDRHEGGE